MRLRSTTGVVGSAARDRWVTIEQRPPDQTSDSGFPVDGAWADLATVAMAREDLEASEIERSAQQVGQAQTRWEMPYMAEMDPDQVDVLKLRRLLYYGRAFDIVGAVPIGRAGIVLITETYPTEAP